METTIQKQYRSSLIKKFLHTKVGARIGFFLGISGFNMIEATHNGKIIRSFNSRVDKGADLTASLLTGAAQNSISTPLPPKYLALSTSSLTAAKGDTTLSGETSATGLGRALGTIAAYTGPAALDGAASYTVSKTFTNSSGGSVTVASAALFDAVSTGNLFVEGNLGTSAVLANGDIFTLTWTINL